MSAKDMVRARRFLERLPDVDVRPATRGWTVFYRGSYAAKLYETGEPRSLANLAAELRRAGLPVRLHGRTLHHDDGPAAAPALALTPPQEDPVPEPAPALYDDPELAELERQIAALEAAEEADADDLDDDDEVAEEVGSGRRAPVFVSPEAAAEARRWVVGQFFLDPDRMVRPKEVRPVLGAAMGLDYPASVGAVSMHVMLPLRVAGFIEPNSPEHTTAPKGYRAGPELRKILEGRVGPSATPSTFGPVDLHLPAVAAPAVAENPMRSAALPHLSEVDSGLAVLRIPVPRWAEVVDQLVGSELEPCFVNVDGAVMIEVAITPWDVAPLAAAFPEAWAA